MNVLEDGKKVFDIEIEALKKTRDALDETFVQIVDLITNCKGKVIITGMGKPGHIAAKLASTFSSLGTPSFRLHPAEAMHGDLGMVSPTDVVIAISFSGESDEIVRILPNIKMIGATLVAITGNKDSTLAKNSDIVQILPKFEEACYLGLAPTSSTTSALCYGDALAVVASGIYGFKDADFGLFHPAGALGKKLLLHVKDVMLCANDTAVVDDNASLKEAIVAMSKRGLSIVTAVKDSKIIGILTDGDLRRLLENNADIYSLEFSQVMTTKPTIIGENRMAIDALKMLKERRFSSMPVINDEGNYVGVITLHGLVGAGIVG